MSQQCWRPPSLTAAGLPSGWRCHPAGPVWSSTSGCCLALCAAVRTSPDLGVPASNVAQHPAAMSVSVFDRTWGQPGPWEAGMTVTRRQMTLSSHGALEEESLMNGGQGSKTQRCEKRTEGTWRLVPIDLWRIGSSVKHSKLHHYEEHVCGLKTHLEQVAKGTQTSGLSHRNEPQERIKFRFLLFTFYYFFISSQYLDL